MGIIIAIHVCQVSSGSAAPQLATADHSSSGLDSILSSEGLNLAFPTARRRTVTRRTAARQQAEVVNDADLKQIKRLGGRSLFLLVRYAGGKTWTFPKAGGWRDDGGGDLVEVVSGREDPVGLHLVGFGPKLAPQFLDDCPATCGQVRSPPGSPGLAFRDAWRATLRQLSGNLILSARTGLSSAIANPRERTGLGASGGLASESLVGGRSSGRAWPAGVLDFLRREVSP